MNALEHYCGDCHHMTEPVDRKCKWCGSSRIHVGSATLPHKRVPSRPEVEHPDVTRQLQYSVGMRLNRGFAILHGGDV